MVEWSIAVEGASHYCAGFVVEWLIAVEGASHYCAGFVVEWSIAVEGASHYSAGFVVEWSIAVEGVVAIHVCSVKDRSVDELAGGRMMGWDGAWVEGRVMGMVRGPASTDV